MAFRCVTTCVQVLAITLETPYPRQTPIQQNHQCEGGIHMTLTICLLWQHQYLNPYQPLQELPSSFASKNCLSL